MADIVALRRRQNASVARPSTDLKELIRTTGLAGLVHQASDHAIAPVVGDVLGRAADDRFLPVLPELRPLLPAGGLRRGSTVSATALPPPGGIGSSSGGAAVRGRSGAGPGFGARGGAGSDSSAGWGLASAGLGATSLLIALLAGASRAGSWCAVVGLPFLGAVAAAEAGVELSRLALVPNPGPDWTSVVAVLLDGFDVVVAAPPGPVASTVAGRLAARARQRGSVLLSYGPWDRADVVLESVGGEWEGLGDGAGRLRRRHLTIVAGGRGAATRRRQVHLWLPTPTGRLESTGGVPQAVRLTAVREAV